MALLGLDIGTSEIKAAAHRLNGGALSTAAVEYTFNQPTPGRFQLSAEALWNAVIHAIRQVTRTCPEPIEALAVSCHGESFVCVDENSEPIYPFILNLDGRAEAQMEQFLEVIGRKRLYEITGLPPHPMYTLPKIVWLAEHTPEIFAAARRFLCVHDFVLSRLCGEAVIDTSLASRTLALDIKSGEWSAELLDIAGLSRDRFALLAPSGTRVGPVRPRLAGDLGLNASTLCVVGAHDQACCALGGGSINTLDAVDVTGTFEAISIVLDKPLLSSRALEANLPCERFAAPARFLTLAYTPGGVVLKWLRDQWAPPSGPSAAYAELLAAADRPPTDLFVFPHLLGTGTPWMDADAPGAIVGLKVGTGKGELVRGALEGVCYEMRWNIEILAGLGIRVARVRAVGGGAKSPLWLQLKADVWGMEVVETPGEAGCRGAAVCAGVGSGAYGSWEEAVQATRQTDQVYEPRVDLHELYSERFERYRTIAGRLYGFSFSPCKDAGPNQIEVLCQKQPWESL